MKWVRPHKSGAYSLFRIMALGYAVLCVIGFFILLFPAPRPAPLVDAKDWKVSGGFFSGTAMPEAREVRKEILKSPATMCWRSWSPATQAMAGKVESAIFTAPDFIAIPVGGFPHEEPGMDIALQRVDSGERLTVANVRMMNQWSEVDLRMPPAFRGARVRLIAETGSTRYFLSVCTPFALTQIAYLQTRMPVLLVVHAMGFGSLMLLMLAAQILVRRYVPEKYSFPFGVACACLAGFLAFFVFYFNLIAGLVYAVALMGGSVAVVSLKPFRPARAACLRLSGDYYIIWFLISLFYVLVLYMVDGGGGSWAANARFTPVRWSSDNQIPMQIAERLFRGHLPKDMLAPWHVSDRPPLLPGLMVLCRTLFRGLVELDLPTPLINVYDQIFAIVANALWAPALLFGLRILGTARRRSLACVFAVAFLPFTLFNNIYIWPKLIAGALALLAFLILYDGYTHRGKKPAPAPFYIASLLGALALLTHGGVVFGLLALIIWVLAVRYFPASRHLLGAAAVGIATLLPWLLWQHFADPPGNALTLYALAGEMHYGNDGAHLFDIIRNAYAHLTWDKWLDLKLHSLAFLIGIPNGAAAYFGLGEMVLPPGTNERDLPQIVRGFLFFLPSLGLLPLSIASFAFVHRKRKREKFFPNGFGAMAAVGAGSLALTVLFLWPAAIVHQLPYQAELEIILAFLLLLAASPRWWALAAGLLTFAHGSIIWIITPAIGALRYDTGAIGMLVFAMLWAGAWLADETHAARPRV